MKKTLIAGIVGGVIAFIWSAVVHMMPMTMGMGLTTFKDKEDATLAAIRSQNLQPGLYFYPGMDMTKQMTKEEEEAWTAKFKAGPSGLLLLQPSGGEPMAARQLVTEFAATLLCALIAAMVLGSTVGSWLCRATLVAMLGLFGWLAISVSQWNWYLFPFDFISLDALDQVIGWFLAGLVMAKIVKPPGPA